MQSLVYIFIALAGLGVGAAAYFGFTFTPIEALSVALAFVVVAFLLVERTLRRRAEARLERAIEDLSRLLSTDAQAGAVLGQRINTLVDVQPGKRLEALEADMSVLGTVVRQVAEAVADLEEARKRQARKEAAWAAANPQAGGVAPAPPVTPVPATPPPPVDPEPVIPLETLKQAIDDNRLVFHIQPIITLPQRKAHGYDLVPRLLLEEGELADPPDFMPKRAGETVIRRIERLSLEEAVTIVRRSRTSGQPATIYVSMSRATLVDAIAIDKTMVLLEANRAVTSSIVLAVAEADWAAMPLNEKAALAAFTSKGLGLALTDARTLRLDFAELAAEGVRSVRANAQRLIEAPETLTDFHLSDVPGYLARFGVELVASGVRNEDQILTLLEDGVKLAQGPHIARPGPVRADLVAERPPAPDRTPSRADA